LTSFSLGSFSDPGVSDAPWTVYVQWGDGQSDSYSQGAQGAIAAESHTYVDNGTYTVSVNVQDKDGGNNALTFKITVANLAPVVAGQFDQSSNEGQNASFDLGSFTDRGKNDSPWKVHVDWGDGSSSDLADRTAQGALDNASHTYADNGSYTATVRVIDKDGDSGNGQFHVTVANLAPQVTAAADQNATEGTSTSFNLGSFTDAGANDSPWAVDVNWGDGSPHTTFSTNSQGTLDSKSHTYADNRSYTVTVTVTDKDGASKSASFQVAVANVNPVVSAASDQNGTEGTSTSFSLGSFSDPGANDGPWSADVNWGDGSAHTTFTSSSQGSLGSQSHTYADNGSYTVSVTVTDKDGGSGAATFKISVANANPVVTAAANQTATEGTSKSFSLGSFSDLGANDGPWAADVNWGDGSPHSTFTNASQGSLGSQSHTYADNGDYTVTVAVTDKDGGSGSATFKISVANADPVATAAADQSSNEGASHDFDLGSFSDPGANDAPWSVDVNWGDGSSHSTGSRPAQGGLGTSSHAYDDNGTYHVTVTVTDKDGGSGSAHFDVTVANVDPTASLANNGPVDEASPATISFSSQHDASNADTAAGFHYAYACDGSSLTGATYAGSSASDSKQCAFDDGPSTHTVRARIIDKDGGYSEYTTDVTLRNAAPTADLGNNGPVDEGSPATISFSNQHDPSSADTAAGFHYAYACDNGSLAGATYAGSGTSATHQCTYSDNGTYTVKGRIIDKDGGYSEYTTDVKPQLRSRLLRGSGRRQPLEGSRRLGRRLELRSCRQDEHRRARQRFAQLRRQRHIPRDGDRDR
jgi:PKD repeat protein